MLSETKSSISLRELFFAGIRFPNFYIEEWKSSLCSHVKAFLNLILCGKIRPKVIVFLAKFTKFNLHKIFEADFSKIKSFRILDRKMQGFFCKYSRLLQV